MDTTINPMISVVMPVYNAEPYLPLAIESILNQTYTNLELIIIDDGSTDRSLSIIKNYKDKRIKIITRDNKGLIFSLNEGVLIAKGKFIARMDADDISTTSRIEKQLHFLRENSLDVIGSNIKLLDEKGEGKYIDYPVSDADVKFRMLSGSPFAHPTIFTKTGILKNNLYRNPIQDDSTTNGYSEDYDLWTRLSIKGFKLGNVPECLLLYRISPFQYTQKFVNQQQFSTSYIAANYGAAKYGLKKESTMYFGFGIGNEPPKDNLYNYVSQLIAIAKENRVSDLWLKVVLGDIFIRMPSSLNNSITTLFRLLLQYTNIMNAKMSFALLFKMFPRIENDNIRGVIVKVARLLNYKV